jgi:hypothetical protein
MEADILKASVMVGHLQLFLPCRSQRFIRAASAHYLAPEMHQGYSILLRICGYTDLLRLTSHLHRSYYAERPS